MRNRTYGGVRGRKTKVGRKLSFSSYSIFSKDALQVAVVRFLFFVLHENTSFPIIFTIIAINNTNA